MIERKRTNTTAEGVMLAGARARALRLFALVFAVAAGLAVVLGALLSAAQAETLGEYNFTKVADSADDGFDPFNFGCTSINTRGDVAFRAGRVAPDGFNTVDGIYRANAADGSLTTIVEDEERFVFIGNNPSMNDLGQVSFAARVDGGNKPDTESILRGNGTTLTTIASTAGEFNFFGFDTSVNNNGVVAFKAELDREFNFDEGLFSGSGGAITTHYLASTSDFDGDDSRPSINNVGDIAFKESINFDSGIFVTEGEGFKTISAPDSDGSVGEPVLNDAGTAAFEKNFDSIVTSNGGPLTTVADTSGQFAFFGFRPPSLNNGGDVAFLATLDDFQTTGIFVGPDAVRDRVIATGDTLDGSTVQNLTFCEEGLSDSGELAFTAQLEAPDSPEGFRMAVFRATPQGPHSECTIRGTAGPDELVGTAADDFICGFMGKDTIRGMGGNDTLLGSAGSDTLYGGGGNDTLKGGNGKDTVIGGSGNDNHYGNNHDDQIDARDEVSGNDAAVGGKGVDSCLADAGDKVGTSCEQ